MTKIRIFDNNEKLYHVASTFININYNLYGLKNILSYILPEEAMSDNYFLSKLRYDLCDMDW